MSVQAIDTKSSVTVAAVKKNEGSSSQDKGAPKADYFSMLFYLLLQAMNIRQGTIVTQSKQIGDNANAQNEMNKANGNIHFSILPPNATENQIDQVQEANQEYAAERQNIQNMLITARQNAQVMMTQTTTNVNILEQDASQDSGWLKTLNTIFQVIDEMSPGR